MRLDIRRHTLVIIPDNDYCFDERDLAYIEEVLGLKKNGDFIMLVRHNASGLSSLGYLETAPVKPTE